MSWPRADLCTSVWLKDYAPNPDIPLSLHSTDIPKWGPFYLSFQDSVNLSSKIAWAVLLILFMTLSCYSHCLRCGRGKGWDDLGEWHWNMYIIICETDLQSKFNAWNRAVKASVLGQQRGMGWGGRGEGGSGWGTHYTHGWFMSMYGKNHNNVVK